jgi:hypothetical protein
MYDLPDSIAKLPLATATIYMYKKTPRRTSIMTEGILVMPLIRE